MNACVNLAVSIRSGFRTLQCPDPAQMVRPTQAASPQPWAGSELNRDTSPGTHRVQQG